MRWIWERYSGIRSVTCTHLNNYSNWYIYHVLIRCLHKLLKLGLEQYILSRCQVEAACEVGDISNSEAPMVGFRGTIRADDTMRVSDECSPHARLQEPISDAQLQMLLRHFQMEQDEFTTQRGWPPKIQRKPISQLESRSRNFKTI